MIRNAGKIPQNIYVSIIMIIAVATQIIFLTDTDGYYIIFITAGVAAAFYISFGKRVIPGLAISTFLSVLVFSFYFTDKSISEALLYTIPILSVNALISFLLSFLLDLFKCQTPDTLRKGVYFLLSMFITALVASIIPAFQFSNFHDSSFLYELGKMNYPIFIGIVIFTTSIILSHHYDEPFSSSCIKTHTVTAFVIVYTLITYLIFSNSIDKIDFWNYAPVFIVLFMVNAFAFSYRTLLFNSYVYIIIYRVTFLDLSNQTQVSSLSNMLNTYLVTLLLITIFTKIIVRESKEKNIELTETKERFSGMLDSTINLLSIRDTLAYEDTNYHENYMNSIFDIAMRIFPEISHGVCATRTDTYVRVLSTKGHDLDFYQSLTIPPNTYKYITFTPVLSTDPMKDFNNALGERYPLIKDDLPQIKESVRILIKLSECCIGVIFFDILEESKDGFTGNDINNIGSFQKMINSFYEMNELAINNSNLKDDIVLSLIRTLELYDQYTGGHSEDVATLAKILAKKMKLSDPEINDVYWAGIVHDIGKIGIKSDIINKPTRLTLEEYKQVQLHSTFGFDVLNRSSELKTIAKLVKHHHEWHNGSGYPDGLKNNEIPLGSQILQVADSVSSMATSRSYQNKKSFDLILAELEMYKGTQFNPVICEHMIDLIKSGIIQNYFKSKK